MQSLPRNKRTILTCALMATTAIAAIFAFAGAFDSANAQTKDPPAAKPKEEGNPNRSIAVASPPKDVNELSMEVAALRTLYLLKAGPDQSDHDSFPGIKDHAKNCAQAPRERKPAQVSTNYNKLLIDFRAALIANNEERIGELSSQLEALADEEQPELDDAVAITEQSKKEGPLVLRGYFDANRIAAYIAAYGKDFPEPYILLKKTVRGYLKGTWPTPELWKETRDFVVEEVSSTIAGFDPKLKASVAERVAKVLDQSYGKSDEWLKKQWAVKGSGMRGEVGNIANIAGPTDVIKHVLERDMAELFSNPRLFKAIEAREEYLNKKSEAAANP